MPALLFTDQCAVAFPEVRVFQLPVGCLEFGIAHTFVGHRSFAFLHFAFWRHCFVQLLSQPLKKRALGQWLIIARIVNAGGMFNALTRALTTSSR